MTTERQQRFQIGHKFKTRGKAPRECTVIDVLKTYNSKGEMVQLEYVEQHDFMGQQVTSRVGDTTVAMGTDPTEFALIVKQLEKDAQ